VFDHYVFDHYGFEASVYDHIVRNARGMLGELTPEQRRGIKQFVARSVIK
jgi:hypothetical protein